MLGRLFRDNKGVAVVEFAFVAPLVALILIGMVNLAMGFNRKLELEQAANRAIEKVMQTTMLDTVMGTLKTEAAAAAKVDPSQVTVDYWLECNGVRQPEYDAVCPGTQRYYRYISVRVWAKYQPIFLGKYAGPNADGSYTLWGDAGIRTQ